MCLVESDFSSKLIFFSLFRIFHIQTLFRFISKTAFTSFSYKNMLVCWISAMMAEFSNSCMFLVSLFLPCFYQSLITVRFREIWSCVDSSPKRFGFLRIQIRLDFVISDFFISDFVISGFVISDFFFPLFWMSSEFTFSSFRFFLRMFRISRVYPPTFSCFSSQPQRRRARPPSWEFLRDSYTQSSGVRKVQTECRS